MLADNGELYTWGNNDNGQLGLGQDSDCADVPTRLNLPRSNNADPVVEIACGGSHSLALTTSGQIYSWGNNEYGQVCPRKLALEQHKIIWTPTDPLDEAGLGRSRIESIACGTAASSLALRRDGQVWAWGQNHMNGFPQILVSPKCIPLQVIVTKVCKSSKGYADPLVEECRCCEQTGPKNVCPRLDLTTLDLIADCLR